jgi:ATP-binding protein involved in chromosome partitioning
MQNLAKSITDKICSYDNDSLSAEYINAKDIKNIAITGQHIIVTIVFGFPLASIKSSWSAALSTYLMQQFPTYTIDIQVSWKISAHVALNIQALGQVKNIIAVAAGKGGVGKSTVAVNLALALQQEGAAVGLLDADIYGPSQPTILAIHDRPIVNNKSIEPLQYHGLQVNSLGFLLPKEEAVVWRGPMISMALQQLLNDSQWSALDYLIIDLPPGTGDIQLTLAQKTPLSAVLLVSTPQTVATQDVRRAAAMFTKLNIPLLGIVENMAGYTCQNCGHSEHIFGNGGVNLLAAELMIPLLTSLPLDPRLGADNTAGLPLLLAEPQSVYALKYCQLARNVAARLAWQAHTYQFPKIIVTNKS